jgi:hypothetical protein
MRGSPILRALIAFFILLGLGFPLHRLLQASAEPAPVLAAEPPEKAGSMTRVQLQVNFTTPPGEFRVLSLGKVVWKEAKPAGQIARELTLAFPKEGIELQVEADWAAGTRGAAQVRLTDPEGLELVKYLFGEGAASEVLAFP